MESPDLNNSAVISPVNPVYTHNDIDTSRLGSRQPPGSFVTAHPPNNFAENPAQTLSEHEVHEIAILIPRP
jgi:hypothetical protein